MKPEIYWDLQRMYYRAKGHIVGEFMSLESQAEWDAFTEECLAFGNDIWFNNPEVWNHEDG